MIEKELTKIVHLFYTKLVLFYSPTEFFDQIKVEPIDEHISIEVTPQNSIVAPTSIDIKER